MHEHPRYRVIPRASRKLAIFFTGTGEADGRFHFYGAGQRCGANALFLNNGRNRWYQDGVPGLGDSLDETIDSIRVWSKRLDAPEIYCVGASMGGSGAALYGALLEAPTLAFGFEAKIGLEGSRSELLGDKDFAFPIPDLTPHLNAPLHAYIGAEDPQDLAATAHLRGLPNVKMTAMRHVSHGPPAYLKKRGMLDPLVSALLSGGPMPEVVTDDTVFADGFVGALQDAWCGYRSGDLARWIDGGRRAVQLNPTSAAANYWLGRGLLKEGRYAEALGPLGLASSLNRDDGEAAYYFGQTVRALGQLDHALKLQVYNAIRWPKNPKPAYDTGFILAKQGHTAEAVPYLERAVDLDPTNRAYADRLSKVRARSGSSR